MIESDIAVIEVLIRTDVDAIESPEGFAEIALPNGKILEVPNHWLRKRKTPRMTKPCPNCQYEMEYDYFYQFWRCRKPECDWREPR